MFLISEQQAEEVNLITEKNANGGKDTFIEGVFLQTNMKNRNGRVYPMEIMEKEVGRYNKEFIKKNQLIYVVQNLKSKFQPISGSIKKAQCKKTFFMS